MFPLISTTYDAEKRIWFGPKRKDLYSENATLGEVICNQLRKQPNRIIQIHDQTGEAMTCGELYRNAQILTRQLVKLNLNAGDIVGLYAANSTHVVTVMLASFLCGCPVNPVYAEFDKESVSALYSVTRPKILFCDVENYENTRRVNEELNLNCKIFVLNGHLEGVANVKELLEWNEELDENFSYPCFDLNGDDTALIVFSSGTTGPAKGVLCSHLAFLNQENAPNLTTDSVLFGFSPMYWISGVWALTTSLMNSCCRIITEKSFTTAYFLDLVEKHKITHVIMNASHLAEVALLEDVTKAQEKMKSIVAFWAGGSVMPTIVHERMERMIPNARERPGFMAAYGMSELAGLVSMNGTIPKQRCASSVGQLVSNRIVRIIDDKGMPLGPNELGQICIQLNQYSWKGYFKNEVATKRALVDNWLHTGDMGHFDSQGFLHFCSRGNDVFKSRNFQIYPQILEGLIAKVPGVFDVCVVGVPNILATNLTAAAVVRTADEEGQRLTAKDIDDHVKANIAEMYNLHGGVYFFEALPKTATGKMLRKTIMDMVVKRSKEENAVN